MKGLKYSIDETVDRIAAGDRLWRVRTLIVDGLTAELKAQGFPNHPNAELWASDAVKLRFQAAELAWSIRQRLNFGSLYITALSLAPSHMDGIEALPMAQEPPCSLDEWLSPMSSEPLCFGETDA